jgi:transposase
MDKITTVDPDLAKQVMAVHATDAEGRMVLRKVLRRGQLLRWTAALPSCDGNGGLWWCPSLGG